MGNVNCCAQTLPDATAWRCGNPSRSVNKDQARALMPIYDYEPSLSLDHEDPASSTGDGVGSSFPDTPQSNGNTFKDVEHEVVVKEASVCSDIEETKEPADSDDQELNTESSDTHALLPCPQSRALLNNKVTLPKFTICNRSGIINQRRQAPILSCSLIPLRLEDYLCVCKYCPRALTIQRAFQLYGFALDHPQSDALLRVLRGCANYDETIMEVDPLVVLHAEKMLEELGFDENQTFRLLIASHFQQP
ncbi:hypothetical protein CCR75_002223 [Bremia lactucae]|uniref:Uncharacterized protein n=1 Tax=Bremia lactucae TaxID=4779 RepID=A0A976FP17_BRELC|nr:hypothetical protein CCR75_002223 [Bremia lactucae]